MKHTKKLAVMAAAMAVASQIGSPQAVAAPNMEDLQMVRQMIANDEFTNLRSFIDENPQVLEGDTDFARVLREYYQQATNVIDDLGVARVERATIDELSEMLNAESIY